MNTRNTFRPSKHDHANTMVWDGDFFCYCSECEQAWEFQNGWKPVPLEFAGRKRVSTDPYRNFREKRSPR